MDRIGDLVLKLQSHVLLAGSVCVGFAEDV